MINIKNMVNKMLDRKSTIRRQENLDYDGRCKHCGRFLKTHIGSRTPWIEYGTCQNNKCSYYLKTGKRFFDSTHKNKE